MQIIHIVKSEEKEDHIFVRPCGCGAVFQQETPTDFICFHNDRIGTKLRLHPKQEPSTEYGGPWNTLMVSLTP